MRPGTRLWDWAIQHYARPGGEALCLALQDQYGQCVSYLLWAAWAAQQGRGLDAARLAEGMNLAKGWEIQTLRPLRQARRALKAPRPGVDAAGQAALREQAKTQELAAERRLLDALEKLTPDPDGPTRDMAAALGEAARAWGPAPRDLIDALARAFSPA